MTKYAELEIGLHRYDAESYSVELRSSQPGNDTDIREFGRAQFDFRQLDELKVNSDAYGEALFQSLFADENVRIEFYNSIAGAQTQNIPLRIRITIGPSAPDLHALRWETLLDPRDRLRLAMDENRPFSRYLSSGDRQPVQPRPKGELRALVAVANPRDLEAKGLSAIDVDKELARARAGLGSIPVTSLPDEASGCRATLENIIQWQRDGDYDILYLVCHGSFSDKTKEPRLYLEDEAGSVAPTSGEVFVSRLKEMQQRPLLVVLASCESAGSRAGDALNALGPRLAEAGIAAVLAMQGKITVDTVAGFMPVFFRELQKDGQIDRALTVARGAVRDRPDCWMPALFMRLKSGRIWYEPGFGKEFKWGALINNIQAGRCTPILGSGLFEPLLGSVREIARRWADEFHYPMAPHESESLPQVAQYLAIKEDRFFPFGELERYLKREIRRRYKDDLPPELQQGSATYDELLEEAAKILWKRQAEDSSCKQVETCDAYRVLAGLPFPIYVTTNLNNLLTVALREAGKDPQVVLCPWYEGAELVETIFDKEDYIPSARRPLVYHLFGRLSEPETAVLTEDDYFDFLIGVTRNLDLLPGQIGKALTSRALLFLGFQLEEWNFRVLLRSILSLEGLKSSSSLAHIAAQIQPEEGRLLEPESARRYLEDYFAKGTDISINIYWGSADDFLRELSHRLEQSEA